MEFIQLMMSQYDIGFFLFILLLVRMNTSVYVWECFCLHPAIWTSLCV